MESELRKDGDLENGDHFLVLQMSWITTAAVVQFLTCDCGVFTGKPIKKLVPQNILLTDVKGAAGIKIWEPVHCRKLLKTETARLNALVASAERDLESDETVPEDIKGKLRVAVGKAKMLLRKKFIQFKDLCYKNLGIESDVRYPVTSEDLAGYWDTIIIQILQVYKIFEEVDVLRKNNWEEPPLKTVNQKKAGAKLNGDKTIISEPV